MIAGTLIFFGSITGYFYSSEDRETKRQKHTYNLKNLAKIFIGLFFNFFRCVLKILPQKKTACKRVLDKTNTKVNTFFEGLYQPKEHKINVASHKSSRSNSLSGLKSWFLLFLLLTRSCIL